MAEAALISSVSEFCSEPRKSPLSKHIPDSSKVRKTPDGLHILAVTLTDPLFQKPSFGETSFCVSRLL